MVDKKPTFEEVAMTATSMEESAWIETTDAGEIGNLSDCSGVQRYASALILAFLPIVAGQVALPAERPQFPPDRVRKLSGEPTKTLEPGTIEAPAITLAISRSWTKAALSVRIGTLQN
jgi:hypothetical protein